MRWTPLVVALMACNNGEDLPGLLDTGWFEDDGVDWSECPQRVVGTTPADGTTGWFYRDAVELLLNAESPELSVRLTDALGRVVPTTLVPDETGLRVTVAVEGDLDANTGYILEYTDCQGPEELGFETSSYGAPLELGVRSIEGRTYHLDIQEGRWVQPGGVGSVLAANFESEILISVRFANDSYIDLLGGQGYFFVGDLLQDTGSSTWDFPVSSFLESPYFETTADEIELSVSGYRLPIVDFELSGTFSASGDEIAGGLLKGSGDTRFAGGALGQPNNEAAFCELAAAVGVGCVACADGMPYCLDVEIDQLVAPAVPGLDMVPVVE
jgi:hypothetical protein